MTSQAIHRPLTRYVIWLIIGLIVWLPLQTPLAIALYQYGGLSADADRVFVLAKDGVVAIAVIFLVIRQFHAIRWQWFDFAAMVFVVVLLIYSVIPLVQPNGPSLNATIAGFRQFILPMELYALGRVAATAGVRFGVVLRPFLVVAVAAAAFTALLFLFVPVSFWTSTLDLVSYVREVQGLPNAHSLWDISVLGSYGLANAEIARAIGPFTHPVGTAAYFVLPLAFASGALFFALGHKSKRAIVWAGLGLLFLAPIVFSISRGGWIAAAMAIMLGGVALRQVRVAFVVVAAFAAFVWFVPPFSVSVHSAINGSDGSALLHEQAVQNGINALSQDPFGRGVGRSDYQFGETFGGAGGEGTLLENTYLSLFVGTGPFGLIAFLAWAVGLVAVLWPGRASLRSHWPRVALIAAILGLAVASLTSATLFAIHHWRELLDPRGIDGRSLAIAQALQRAAPLARSAIDIVSAISLNDRRSPRGAGLVVRSDLHPAGRS